MGELSPLRHGRFTASAISSLMGGPDAFNTAVAAVAAERSGAVEVAGNGYESPWMARGTALEPEAREAVREYVHATGGVMEETDGKAHPEIPSLWATPDSKLRYSDKTGVLDFKVPKPENWYKLKIQVQTGYKPKVKATRNPECPLEDLVDGAYWWQSQCQMMVYDAACGGIAYYNPHEKPGSRIILIPIAKCAIAHQQIAERVAEAEAILTNLGFPFLEF